VLAFAQHGIDQVIALVLAFATASTHCGINQGMVSAFTLKWRQVVSICWRPGYFGDANTDLVVWTDVSQVVL